ncbi:MAG: hypothetical protein K2K70_07145 [Lachnospiraceae bacterium]|nr:hypothetical protein [Lachnospiraceae bacterium]
MKQILCFGDSNTYGLVPGTNDCKTVYDASAGVIGLGIKQLLKQIKEIAPKAGILLIARIQSEEDGTS